MPVDMSSELVGPHLRRFRTNQTFRFFSHATSNVSLRKYPNPHFILGLDVSILSEERRGRCVEGAPRQRHFMSTNIYFGNLLAVGTCSGTPVSPHYHKCPNGAISATFRSLCHMVYPFGTYVSTVPLPRPTGVSQVSPLW